MGLSLIVAVLVVWGAPAIVRCLWRRPWTGAMTAATVRAGAVMLVTVALAGWAGLAGMLGTLAALALLAGPLIAVRPDLRRWALTATLAHRPSTPRLRPLHLALLLWLAPPVLPPPLTLRRRRRRRRDSR